VKSNVKKMSARFRAGGWGVGIGFKRVREKKNTQEKGVIRSDYCAS
jgi:hypothetical protein